jgi:hypothetical protein
LRFFYSSAFTNVPKCAVSDLPVRIPYGLVLFWMGLGLGYRAYGVPWAAFHATQLHNHLSN